MPTIAEAISEGAERLRASGVAEERRTAAVLLGHLLDTSRARLLIRSKEEIDEALFRQYLALINRRASGEPLQYITGHQEFYGLDFIVTPCVLIPRPETEFLVERVITLARAHQNESGPLVVDVGTGSGCIAITLAAHIPDARVIAIDISRAALDVARANAERHGAGERIEFVEGDMLVPLSGRGLEGAVDFLASNPPYVPSGSPELLQREVRDWEPQVALFGGEGGLDFYSRLLADGKSYVKPGGYLVFEIGYSQLDAIREMIISAEWDFIEVTHDLQGIPRTLTLRRVLL